ncbi:hypothetical protein D3C86_1514910 [compost metagenome]
MRRIPLPGQADAFQLLRFGQGRPELAHQGQCSLLQHAIGFTVGIPADDPARRVGSVGRDAGQFQCRAVGDREMTGYMGDVNRLGAGHLVEVGAGGMALLGKQRVVVPRTADPLLRADLGLLRLE